MATTKKKPAPAAAARKPKAKARVKAPAAEAVKPAATSVAVKAAKAKAPKVKATQAKADKVKADKADKARKPKLVRDSFTIPKTEYAVLEELKLRAAKLGRPTKKSEVLRAGVQALAAMGDAAFLATVGAVPALKTGRPAKL